MSPQGTCIAAAQILVGMYACTQNKWLTATVYFAVAGAFRSNGILLSGFILWGLMVQPFLFGKKVRFPLRSNLR